VALSASVVAGLQHLLGPAGVVLTREGRLTYESDMLTLYKGMPDAVVLPTSTEEVQAVVRRSAARPGCPWCRAARARG